MDTNIGTKFRRATGWFIHGYLALVLAALMMPLVSLGPAHAGATGKAGTSELLLVAVDEARIVRLNRDPASVVVGNPLIADVVVQEGGLLVIVGKNYGTTNVIALDENGNELTNMDVNVRTGGRNAVSLFRGTARMSYNCSPRCETELDVGDDGDHFEAIQKAIGNKLKLSNGVVQGK
ncbi:MAG: pilus assembly protein N-terminal domain-containing protein [Alphaproteobacteria bacterium]